MARPNMEMPIFSRMYDLLAWLVTTVEKFPRTQRFVLASRLLDTAHACHDTLIRARKVPVAQRRATLLEADIKLESLRMQLRLAQDLKCISLAQYEYASGLTTQVGKLLGTWMKNLN